MRPSGTTSRHLSLPACRREVRALTGAVALGCWMLMGLLNLTATSQTITQRLEIGRRDPKPTAYEFCRTDGGLVTVGRTRRNSSRYMGITRYDQQFKKVWAEQFLRQNGQKTIEFLAVVGERILVFISENVPGEPAVLLYYYEYTLEGREVENARRLTTIPEKGSRAPRIQFRYSINRQLLSCFFEAPQEDDRVPIQLPYFIFQAESEGFVAGQIQLPYGADNLEIVESRLGSQGNLFLMGKYFRQNKIEQPRDVHFMLFRQDVQKDSLTETFVALEDRYLVDLTFKPDPEENIYFAGLYSQQGMAQVTGTVYGQIRADTLATLRTEAFDEKFLIRYLSARQIEKGRELADFFLDDIILRSDGGVLMLLEQYYVTQSVFNRNLYGSYYTREQYHYDDVVLISMDPDGEIEWNAVVDKEQSGEYTSELSYLCLVTHNSIDIYYKTRLKGLGTNVYYVQVDYAGNVGKPRPLFGAFSNSDSFLRESSEQVSSREAILAIYRNRDRAFSLVKLEF